MPESDTRIKRVSLYNIHRNKNRHYIRHKWLQRPCSVRQSRFKISCEEGNIHKTLFSDRPLFWKYLSNIYSSFPGFIYLAMASREFFWNLHRGTLQYLKKVIKFFTLFIWFFRNCYAAYWWWHGAYTFFFTALLLVQIVKYLFWADDRVNKFDW